MVVIRAATIVIAVIINRVILATNRKAAPRKVIKAATNQVSNRVIAVSKAAADVAVVAAVADVIAMIAAAHNPKVSKVAARSKRQL